MKIFFCLFCLSLPAFAGDLDTVSVVRTNYLTAASNYREVNGQLYNTQRSNLWVTRTFQFVRMEQGNIIAKTITYTPIYDQIYTPDPLVSSGNFLGVIPGSGPGGVSRRLIKKVRKVGPPVAIKNCLVKAPTIDQEFSSIVMRTGTFKNDGQNFELWDAGKPHVVAAVVTNRISQPSPKAL